VQQRYADRLRPQGIGIGCSVLQCVAVCCNVLQCVAVCCNVLQRVLSMQTADSGVETARKPPATPRHRYTCKGIAVCCKSVTVICSVLQCVVNICWRQTAVLQRHTNRLRDRATGIRCSVLRYVAVCCSVSQCVAAAHRRDRREYVFLTD